MSWPPPTPEAHGISKCEYCQLSKEKEERKVTEKEKKKPINESHNNLPVSNTEAMTRWRWGNDCGIPDPAFEGFLGVARLV